MSKDSASSNWGPPPGWKAPGPGYAMDLGSSEGVAAVPGDGWKVIVDGHALPVIAFTISSTYVCVLTWSRKLNLIVQARGELIPPS